MRISAAISAIGLAMCAVGGGTVHCQEPTFGTQIEVRRVLIDVRVIHHDGTAVAGLAPEDFLVSIDGSRVEVEAVDWISGKAVLETTTDAPVDIDPAGGEDRAPPHRRLIVMLFQKDFQLARLRGLYRVSDPAVDLARDLGGEDLVAVAVFGSHLQLHSDFTNRHDMLEDILTVPEIFSDKQSLGQVPGFSVAEHLDIQRARKATNLSEALATLGEALAHIEGPKTLVLFGWGIGTYQGKMGVVTMDREYVEALRTLAKARVTVFALDITDADYHTLEEGLLKLTDDTGGLYIKAHQFPEVATRKLGKMLAGSYQLTLVPPVDLEEDFKVRVRVTQPGTEIYVRRWNFLPDDSEK